ncbi:MAG: maleylpyruvate isomerase N-terminal domain-containing protein, partial [Jatrophihabitans sp.]
MPRRLVTELESFLAQSVLLVEWLDALAPEDFASASVLPGWDVRLLVGHLVHLQSGLARRLRDRSSQVPFPMAEYVRRYAPAADDIAAATIATTGARHHVELINSLRDGGPIREAADGVADRTAITGGRGPITALDWARTRTIDLVVHCDDLSRSLPGRPEVPRHRAAMASASRSLAEILAAQSPGRSVELRVPPF